MNNKYFYLLCFSGCLFWHSAVAQVNFLGKPGLMVIPTADWQEDRELGLTFSYLPGEYSIFQSLGERNTVNFYNARISFTSFMEASLSIAYRPLMADKIGVGDRQLDFRFKLFREKKYFPAIVLGWTPPGSVSPVMAHDYLVATKNIHTGIGNFQVTGGYGSPYIFRRVRGSDNFMELELQKKIDFQNIDYLVGFFGGISYMPVSFGGVMLEYDTRTINAGAFVQYRDWLYLQVYTFETKEIAFQVSTQLNLDFSPRSLRRYEKNLD